MNDIQIEYFLAVANNLSFTKTAQELFVTQPAVSKQISALEKELDVALFLRTNKGTELTAAGKVMYEFFVGEKLRLAKTLERAKRIEQKNELSGPLKIACLEDWNIRGFFPRLLRIFREQYPAVQVQLQSFGVRALVQALSRNEADVILTLNVTLNDLGGITVKKVAEIPRILLYSADHPMAQKDIVTPADFRNDTFFVMGEKELPNGVKLIKEFCSPYGFEPKVECVSGIDAMRMCVQNGIGVAISDLWSNATDRNDFRYIILNETHEVSMAWKTEAESEKIRILAAVLSGLLSVGQEQAADTEDDIEQNNEETP